MLISLSSRLGRVARETVSFRRPLRKGTALFGALICLSFLSFLAPVGAQEINTVRIDGNLSVLSSDLNPFLVPIYIQHSPDVDAVHIGLDYDELMLHFSGSYELDGAVGSDPAYIIHDDGTGDSQGGRINLLVPFDPSHAVEQEALLIQLKFTLVNPTNKIDYGYRISSDFKIHGPSTFFVKTGDEHQVWPDAALDGNLTIYACNALEVGSAQISPSGQSFSIPLYVTHVQSEAMPFSMGLDYDEVYLELVGVTPVSPLLIPGMGSFDKKTESGRAWIQWSLPNGQYPQLLRHHLLDLVFIYRAGAGVPESSILKLLPTFNGATLTPEGGAIGEIRGGALFIVGPKFIRGDADGSKEIDVNDAFVILSFVTGLDFGAANSLKCLDAMDVDAGGQTDISDAIQVLNFLFLSGPPPAAPFPAAGSLSAEDPSLGCASGDPVFEPLPMATGF